MTEVIEKTEYKKGYKKTKLGWIPEDWKMVKIKNLTCVKSGSTPLRANYNKYFKDGTIKWVKTLDLNNGVLQDTQEKITDIAIRESSCSIFPKNTVLVAMYGGFNQIGRTGLMNFDGCINQALSAILPNDKFNPVFMLNWLNYNVLEWRNYAASSRKDPNITKNDVEKFIVILPSKQEQKKIAEILSAWDDGIETLEKLIEQKEILKKATMQKLFLEKESWEMMRFDKIFKDFCKKNCPRERLLSATQENGVIPRDMLSGKVMSPEGSLDGYKLIEAGDFVISLRSFQGGLEYSKYRGILSPAYTVLKNIIDIDKDFYRHFFKSYKFIEKYLSISVIGIRDGKQISYLDLSSVKIPYPPLEEQEKIGKILNCYDEEIQLLNSKLEKLKKQKKGLMQKLLTGQIRVKV